MTHSDRNFALLEIGIASEAYASSGSIREVDFLIGQKPLALVVREHDSQIFHDILVRNLGNVGEWNQRAVDAYNRMMTSREVKIRAVFLHDDRDEIIELFLMFAGHFVYE